MRTRKAPERITLQDGDNIASDPDRICEIFTKHFSSAYSSSRDSGCPLGFTPLDDVIQMPKITVEDVKTQPAFEEVIRSRQYSMLYCKRLL